MVELGAIDGPEDLVAVPADELDDLARQVREFLVEKVSRTGGHLGPNLGVVELTIALHRVFDSPRDPIVFDTGHQAYVHKMLTGRQRLLRAAPGAAGCPATRAGPRPSTTSSRTARLDGAVLGRRHRQGVRAARRADRHVVAVIGDGALTGGMAWEALNNIAAGRTAAW